MTFDHRVPSEQVARLAELGLLTASLLHEIRHPILSIQATAELALVSDNGCAAQWQRILDNAHHLRTLLEPHIGMGREGTAVASVDVRAELRAATQMLEPLRKEVGAEILADLPQGMLVVRAPQTALRQVLVNLVHNALDAVRMSPNKCVIVRVKSRGKHVVIEVIDAGNGVPETLQDQLFNAFVSGKPSGMGTGLGLYLAARLVRQAQGEIRLAETGPQGSTFEVLWPAS